MRPALGDLMSVNDDEPIRILKRGQPVGDSRVVLPAVSL